MRQEHHFVVDALPVGIFIFPGNQSRFGNKDRDRAGISRDVHEGLDIQSILSQSRLAQRRGVAPFRKDAFLPMRKFQV
jgi:hypothetical protein